MSALPDRRRFAWLRSPRLFVVGLALLVLLPLVITAVIARRGAATAEARVEESRLALAETTALSINAFIDAHLATLRTLSRSPDIRDLGNRPNLLGVLEQALVDMPDWERLQVYQADGEPIVSVGSEPTGGSFTDDAALRAALIDQRPVVGSAVAGRRPGAPTVPLVIAVEFVNSATGVTVAWLSTGRLLDALASAPQREGVQLEVLDRNGEAFIRSQGEARSPATTAAGEAARPALAGESGTARARGDGEETLAAFAPVERAGWAVLATQPVDQAFAGIRRQLRDELVLLASAGAFIALVTLLLGERLTRSYQRQIEATSRVDQFISSASHDLKTPLTAIKTLAQLLQRRLARADLPEAEWFREGLVDIDNQTNRMSGQIDELLDLSRFRRSEPVELRRRPTDLVRLARRAAADAQKVTNRHTITVETELTELTGQWDSERIDRVIANLLSNAVKYSPSGGEVTLSLGRERFGLAGEYAVMAVQDRGIGIPAADLPHVFDQFRRGSNVTGRISGTGIGLAGVRRLVEEHGGSISVESTEGSGSRFTVRLPLGEQKAL